MKVTSLVLISNASTEAVASVQPVTLVIPTSSIRSSFNASHAQGHECRSPWDALTSWWYNTRSDDPYWYFGPFGGKWAVFNSYRSGGTENVHWKYTDDPSDLECLQDWNYYGQDGATLIAKIQARTTLERVRAPGVSQRRCRILPVGDCFF